MRQCNYCGGRAREVPSPKPQREALHGHHIAQPWFGALGFELLSRPSGRDDREYDVPFLPVDSLAGIVFQVGPDAVEHITVAFLSVSQWLAIERIDGRRSQMIRCQIAQSGGIPIIMRRAKLLQRNAGQSQTEMG